MTQLCIEDRFGAEVLNPSYNWQPLVEGTHECRVLICPEADGGYSAHAIRLPGVVSQGSTPDEALDNILEAFKETIQCYLESGDSIPWQAITIDRPAGCFERWVLVNV
jgi:predicted RNase H-like HicB family nuclease